MNFSTVKLGDIAKVFNGKTPAESEQRQSGFPVLKIRDVDENGVFRGRFDSFVDQELANQFPDKQICVKDVMILNAAHNADYVASKLFFADERVAGALSTGEWLIIRADEEKVDPRFIHFWLQDARTKHSLRLLVKGIHLYPKDVAELDISLPPLTEQKRIASLLARADRLRHLRRTAHELGESLLQSVFLEMFYYSETKWEQALVEDLVKKKNNAIRTGPFGSQLLHSEFTETGDVLVLGIDNAVQNEFSWGKPRYITQEKYQELKRYTVFPGDLIITIMATNGRVAVVPDNIPLAINTKHLCCITLEQKVCLPKFLQACLLYHPAVLKQMGGSERGAVMPGLNMEIIKNLVVPVPPLNLQEEFAGVVARVESLRGRMSEGERQVEGLFESLLAESFGG